MSDGDMNFNGNPWLGGLYQKIGKMYDEIDQSMSQDTVKYARNQLQTVGENVRKLGSHVMFDMPFPSFLASKSNSASSLGRNSVVKPKINVQVIDIESPADAKTEQPTAKEFMSSSSKEFSVTAADIRSNLIDNHWSSENLEDDSEVRKVSTSEVPELLCSCDGSAELSSLSSLTITGQEAENETKNQVPSSSESSVPTNADGKDDVKSSSQNVLTESSVLSFSTILDQVVEIETKDQMLSSSDSSGSTHAEVKDVKSSQSPSINKDQQDVDDLFARIPCPSTTDDPQSDLPRPAELFCDPAVECAADVSTVVHCSELGFPVPSCQSEQTNDVSTFSSSSSLPKPLNLVEASHSGLTQTEGTTCEVYFDPSSHDIGLCAIPRDSPPVLLPRSYLLVDNSRSSFPRTLALNIAGQSTSSISLPEDLPMEKIDLSDNVELDQRDVTVNNDINLSVSSRRGCFNPYKKMFQNPFASKKRLERDYKLLSIWYGDIDTEFSEITQSKRTLNPDVQNKGVIEDEWEIV